MAGSASGAMEGGAVAWEKLKEVLDKDSNTEPKALKDKGKKEKKHNSEKISKTGGELAKVEELDETEEEKEKRRQSIRANAWRNSARVTVAQSLVAMNDSTVAPKKEIQKVS